MRVVDRFSTLVSKGVISWGSTHVSLYLLQKSRLRPFIIAHKKMTVFQMPAGGDFMSPQ